MNKRNHPDVPQHLLPEYDEYVDDALDLVRGRLSKDEEAAVRKRMDEDPIYKAVIDDIVDAESAPPLPKAELEARLAEFWKKAGVEPVTPVLTQEDEATAADLADFAERTRARETVWRRRLVKIGAIAATVVGLMFGSWFYFDSFWTDYRTASYVTSTIDLPDGSKVVLAPSSTFRHLDKMESARGSLRRDTYLTGEGEFTVQPISDVPFSITTENATIVVIGTRFRVKAGGALTEVRVEEGKVSVQAIDERGDAQGAAVTLGAGSSARVIGGTVMVDSTNGGTR